MSARTSSRSSVDVSTFETSNRADTSRSLRSDSRCSRPFSMMPATWFAIVCRKSISVRSKSRGSTVCTFMTPITSSRDTSGTDSIEVNRPTSTDGTFFQRRAAHRTRIQAVRRHETEQPFALLEEIQTRHFGAYRVSGAVDHDAEHLVPVARGRRELRDLVQEGKLTQFPFGVDGGHRVKDRDEPPIDSRYAHRDPHREAHEALRLARRGRRTRPRGARGRGVRLPRTERRWKNDDAAPAVRAHRRDVG